MAGTVENAGDLASAIRAGHVPEETDKLEDRPKPKRQPSVPPKPAPQQEHFVGGPCPRKGCQGRLKAVSIVDTPEGRQMHLFCAICSHKPKNNVVLIPRTVLRKR